MSKEESKRSVHDELGIRWYHKVEKPHELARELTASTGVLHFVVALDYGTLERSSDGRIRRAGVLDSAGKVLGSKMFLPFTQPALASFLDSVRLDPTLGPSCLNMYEEANTDRPRRVGFDLEFELDRALKDGTLDHKERAAALWPANYAAVAASPELFLSRTLVDRILPAFNALAGTAFTTRDCDALDSSTTTRLSFHFALPSVLPTTSALKHFSAWMRATFESASEPLSPLLDVSVYTTCRNMRLVLNCKPFKPGAAVDRPWLRPVSRVGAIEFAATHDAATLDGHHAFTLSLLQQHMWTTGASGSLQLEERLREWYSGFCTRGRPEAPPARARARDAPDAAPPIKRARSGASHIVPASALALYAAHKGIPASSVTVLSNTLRLGDDTGSLTGDIRVVRGTGARSDPERLHVSTMGNVFLAGANDANIATALVERALAPSRAASFTDWFAVGGALHAVAPSPAMFAIWDHFSRLCPAKYAAKECAARWTSFNGKWSLGTLIHMAREDDAQETAAILRGVPSVLIGNISPAAAVMPRGRAATTPELSATRRLLRTVLGDVTSVPTAVSNVWTGSWAAPPGRRCCHGTVHDAPTTFETRVSHLRRCAAPRCAGTVGGSYWNARTACSTCGTKHCTTCQRAASPAHVCSAADVAGVARDRLTADAMAYETCHACSPTPAVLGPLRLAIPRTAPPVSADVYAPVLAAQHPSWALRPCPVFSCTLHTFLVVFTITDGGKLEHGDGARRALGVTTECDVVLGVKRGTKPYAWSSVAHWFREPLRAWFLCEHAATAALLPPPEERPPRPPLWTLPCCASVKPCGRKTCQMLTHEPWLKLRQLQAHGLLAETPAAGVETREGGV
jgi:hypothetical protein